MSDEQAAIGDAPHVEFDPVGAHLVGQTERLRCVLRGSDRSAAVTQNQHESIMVQAPDAIRTADELDLII